MNKAELIAAIAPLGLKKADEMIVDDLKVIHGLQQELAGQKEINAKLNDALEAAPKGKAGETILKLDGVSYKLLAPKSSYKGREVTAEVLKADKKLFAELVKIGAGTLQKVGG